MLLICPIRPEVSSIYLTTLQECGMLTMRPIADREPAAGHPVVAAQPEAEQQAAAQNRQMDPLLQAALTGTVFLGSVIASVLNAMNRQ